MKNQKSSWFQWLSDVGCDDASLVGSKGASLGELLRAGFSIPPGFVITTGGCSEVIHRALGSTDIQRRWDNLSPENWSEVKQLSTKIRAEIESVDLDPFLEKGIEEHYGILSKSYDTNDLPVAIRSSATEEDLPGATFAGLLDTYLGVCGREKLIQYFRKCVSSLFTPRSIAYRRQHSFNQMDLRISVIVQQLISATCSGVMFTLNTKNGDRSVVSLEASFGLGDSVVSGQVNPDSYLINKVTDEVLHRYISCKSTALQYDPVTQSCVCVNLPIEVQTEPTLSDKDLRSLSRIAKSIEAHYQRPMDIEWAVDRAKLDQQSIYILQARPETIWRESMHSTSLHEDTVNETDLIVQALLKGRQLSC